MAAAKVWMEPTSRPSRPLSALPVRGGTPLTGGYGNWGVPSTHPSGPTGIGGGAVSSSSGKNHSNPNSQQFPTNKPNSTANQLKQRPKSALTRPGRHMKRSGSAHGNTTLDTLLFDGLFAPHQYAKHGGGGTTAANGTHHNSGGANGFISASANNIAAVKMNPYGYQLGKTAGGNNYSNLDKRKNPIRGGIKNRAVSPAGSTGSGAGGIIRENSNTGGINNNGSREQKKRTSAEHFLATMNIPGNPHSKPGSRAGSKPNAGMITTQQQNQANVQSDLTKTLQTIKQQIEREKMRLAAPNKFNKYDTRMNWQQTPTSGASGGMKQRPQTAGMYRTRTSGSGGSNTNVISPGASKQNNNNSSDRMLRELNDHTAAAPKQRQRPTTAHVDRLRTVAASDPRLNLHNRAGALGNNHTRPTSAHPASAAHHAAHDLQYVLHHERPKSASAASSSRQVKADMVDRSGKTIPSTLLEGGSYVTGKTIGQGAYASVRVCTHHPSEKNYAVKIFDKTRSHWENRKKLVYREVKLMEKICRDNEHICKFLEYVDCSNFLHLFQELVNGGNLRQELNKKQLRRISEGTVRNYFWQICDGIEYLHHNLVVHRDIKLENLLLHHNSHGVTIKIVDFGFAVKLQTPTQKLKVFCGTPSYMSPEIVAGKEYSGFQSDVWALGVVLYVLLCGRFPFKANQEHELYHKIRRGQFSLADNHVSSTAKRVIKGILRVDGNLRPVVSQVVNHAWVLSGSTAAMAGRHSEHAQQERSSQNISTSSSKEIDLGIIADNSTHSNGVVAGTTGGGFTEGITLSRPSSAAGGASTSGAGPGRVDSASFVGVAPDTIEGETPRHYTNSLSNSQTGVYAATTLDKLSTGE
ncbi:unnamed protein product [Amoebophrya sp. A120]|nr:unnamed protein product [Amoebophrya sp. A120]|eukprot:GSA120T00019608001.1